MNEKNRRNVWFVESADPQKITYKEQHEKRIALDESIEVEINSIDDLFILAEQCRTFWECALIIDFKNRKIILYNGWME